MNGTLTLIPTPIAEEGELEPCAFHLLFKAATENINQSLFVIEDLKPGRRRWLQFKLPREVVEDFILYNEHTAKVVAKELLIHLQSGKNVFLMSDGGLPAFYDPGVELVKLCHQHKIKVTATPFFNSVILALALSGINHKKFYFEGFLSTDKEERFKAIHAVLQRRETSIVMDTPYRLKRLLEELRDQWQVAAFAKKIFLALDLNKNTEELITGSPDELLKTITEFKREFVLVVGS